MKKILILILLLPLFAEAQRIQYVNTYGYEYQRLLTDTLFSTPNDTFSVPVIYRKRNFLSRKGNTLFIWDTTALVWSAVTGSGSGTVTSVGLTMPSAFTVTGSPVTTSGTLAVTGAGTTAEYIRGDGSLATLAVTGANNGDTLINGMIGLGGILIRATRISASNNRLTFDSLGLGSIFRSYPNASGATSRFITLSNSNGTDSAYINVGGRTGGATQREFNAGINVTANNSLFAVFGKNVGGTYVYGGLNAFSPTRNSLIIADTLSAYMSSGKTSPSTAVSSIYLYPDSMALSQTDGDYYVYNLNRITDTTGLDLMAFDRSNSEWVRIPSDIVGGGGGATPTLQQVITAGATLTGSNSIIYGANQLHFSGTNNFLVEASSGTNAAISVHGNNGTLIQGGVNTTVLVSEDSIKINTSTGGIINIDELRSLRNADDSMVVWQPSTGAFGMRPIPSGGASGITIGTTTITSGTTTRILYDNAGVVGEYTLTGTGTVVAMQTAPTFVTSITSPLVIGGTGTTDDLILQSTSGVAAAGSVVQIKTGNNGALTAYSLNELGSATIGSTAAATSTVPLIVTGPTSHATYMQQWTKNASNYWAAITQSGAIRFTNDGTEITGNDYAELGYITGVGGPGFVNRSVDPDPVFLLGASATEALRMKSTYGLGWSSSTATAAASDAAIGRNTTRQLYIQGIGSSGTNAVARPFILNNPTSGTAAAGMGTGQEFQFENGSGTQSVMMQIDAVSTDVTAASEDADFVVTVKDAGALVEGFRINSDGKPIFRTTVTAGGTTGNQTIDKATGTVNFATGTSTLTVTNSLVTATSIVFAVIRTNDAAALIKNVVPGAGSFVITLNAATGAETSVGFLVINN